MAGALALPRALNSLNLLWLWIHFGLLLYNSANPLVMGLLFFLDCDADSVEHAVDEHKTQLHGHFDPQSETYWIERDAGELPSETVYRLF